MISFGFVCLEIFFIRIYFASNKNIIALKADIVFIDDFNTI